MKVIISIPAYNEEKTLGEVIKEIKEIMGSYDYSILVVNDGSEDNTAKIAREIGAIVFSHDRRKGLAETFKFEMKKCLELRADIIVHTDADGQYKAADILKLLKKIEEGYDLVLGSRFEHGVYEGSFMKRWGNIAFAKVFSNILGIKITDTTTGFRAFTREVAKLPLINNFTYTQEQLIRAGKNNMRIAEIPIKTNKTRESRLFKNSFTYAFRAWINIFRIYRDFDPLKFFGTIGLIFSLIGFLIGLWFVYLHFTSGIEGHLGLMILMILLILMGIQIMLFGFFADMNKK